MCVCLCIFVYVVCACVNVYVCVWSLCVCVSTFDVIRIGLSLDLTGDLKFMKEAQECWETIVCIPCKKLHFQFLYSFR